MAPENVQFSAFFSDKIVKIGFIKLPKNITKIFFSTEKLKRIVKNELKSIVTKFQRIWLINLGGIIVFLKVELFLKCFGIVWDVCTA